MHVDTSTVAAVQYIIAVLTTTYFLIYEFITPLQYRKHLLILTTFERTLADITEGALLVSIAVVS